MYEYILFFNMPVIKHQIYTRAKHASVRAKQTTDSRERLFIKPRVHPLNIFDAFVLSYQYLREFCLLH